MIHHLKTLVALGSLLMIGGIIYAQVPHDGSNESDTPQRDEKTKQALAFVRTLYEEITRPEAGSTCSLSCAVEVAARGPNDSLFERKSDVRYTCREDRIGVESSDMSLYQDSSVGVAVIPTKKEIRIFPSSGKQLKETREKSMQTFRDELFTKSGVEKYEVKGDEHRLTLVPQREFRDLHGIERVEIAFVPDERRIVSIDAEFGRQASYHSMTMRYGPLECSDRSSDDGKIHASPLAGIFESNGRLRPDYSGYNVIDLRSK